MTQPSLWLYFADASTVVKAVMLLLLGASITSWTFIFQRGFILKKARDAVLQFDEAFWSGQDLATLYQTYQRDGAEKQGLARIFKAGFGEYRRAKGSAYEMEAVQRAMRVATTKEMDSLEKHLSFLASVGSTSPYVGLFGTVWGIMTAFHALGNVQQATIAMVAPGISEALIATAMGLFAAIPAVLAYNRYTHVVERLYNQYETFQEEFSNILSHQSDSCA